MWLVSVYVTTIQALGIRGAFLIMFVDLGCISTVVPTKTDSDIIFRLQLLSKTLI